MYFSLRSYLFNTTDADGISRWLGQLNRSEQDKQHINNMVNVTNIRILRIDSLWNERVVTVIWMVTIDIIVWVVMVKADDGAIVLYYISSSSKSSIYNGAHVCMRILSVFTILRPCQSILKWNENIHPNASTLDICLGLYSLHFVSLFMRNAWSFSSHILRFRYSTNGK